MAKKKAKKESPPETIESHVDKLYPPPDDGWKDGDPLTHERIEWMKLREQRIAQAKESKLQKEIDERKRQREGKRQCKYDRADGRQCTGATVGASKYCEQHVKECPECFERIRKDEKYCPTHACELCGDKRDIQGPNCSRCQKDLTKALMGHVDLAPHLPDQRALEDAALAGI